MYAVLWLIAVQVKIHQCREKLTALKHPEIQMLIKTLNSEAWKCKAAEASTDLVLSPCHPKASAPSGSDSTAYQNASPVIFQKPRQEFSKPRSKRTKIGQILKSMFARMGSVLPKMLGSVWQTRPSILCSQMGKAVQPKRSPWVSCWTPFPDTHRKHPEPEFLLIQQEKQRDEIWNKRRGWGKRIRGRKRRTL